MGQKYLFKAKNARHFNKYGIDLTVYDEKFPLANVVHVRVKKGHFEEFYQLKSTFIYYIVKGRGIYYLNGKKVEVEKGDLIVIPPKTRIHYFGNMEMVLTVSPAFNEKNERHVRFVDKKENPYIKSNSR